VTGIVARARSGNDFAMQSQKASPIRAARFSLGDARPLVRAEYVDVDVMATSAEAAFTAGKIAFGLYPDCGMSRDDLALDAVAFSARAVPAALALNRSRCEAIFPNDRATKLVSFGNAARLGRGVSLYRAHRAWYRASVLCNDSSGHNRKGVSGSAEIS
jgi:hypothetical protein